MTAEAYETAKIYPYEFNLAGEKKIKSESCDVCNIVQCAQT